MARSRSGRPVLDECWWIDVRLWKRNGRLHPDCQFVECWTIDDEPAGSIGVVVKPHSVLLHYAVQIAAQSHARTVQQIVPIVGCRVLLGADALGFNVRQRWTKDDPADGAPPSCTLSSHCSLAGVALGSAMQASARPLASGGSGPRAKSASGLAAATVSWICFRQGQRGCTHPPITACAADTTARSPISPAIIPRRP
jgi:hypothetical protein